MKTVLPLFIMIDACGWEIIRNDPFLGKVAPHRTKLRSVFGYSSTCVPSILSGRWPAEHRNWCYFVHDPERSPFRSLRRLKMLPEFLTSRRIVRRQLSKWVKKRLGYEGYFDLYNIPFKYIDLFDFTEKKSPLQPGGMNRGTNIFDYLKAQDTPWFVSDPAKSEEQNLDGLLQKIGTESIDFAFMYWPALDGLLHSAGNDSPQIAPKLRQYEGWIEQLLSRAENHYEEVHLYVFSDHGMANCDVHLNLKKFVDQLGLKFGTDYVVVYDSTMARFWFHNETSRRAVIQLLEGIPLGRILPDEELKSLNAYFPDHYFGELIYLVKEGTLIVPSHMGERPIRAMHGYHPNDPQSYAALCSNQAALPFEATAIPHIFNIMVEEATRAKQANSSSFINEPIPVNL
ncbi:MAG: alkaline phosphatase family protein [Verrucomicrobiota bacterium]|nr:alkaline phosphatase family protein [Verrucomicrobiota bacterium]